MLDPERTEQVEELLEDLFAYHPPLTNEEREKHDIINCETRALARLMLELIDNPAEATVVIRKIFEVRMAANQAVCWERVGISIRELFIPTGTSTGLSRNTGTSTGLSRKTSD